MELRRLLPVVALAALAWPAAASGHASLVRSTPADGAALGHAPREVRLVFDDAVRPVGGAEAVRDRGGSVLGGRERLRGPRVIVVPLRPRLATGDYSVRWRALSDDGHVIAGALAFSVGTGRPPAGSVLTAGETGPGIRSIVSRWLFLAGLLVVVGAAVFELVVVRGEELPRLAIVLLAGFVAAFLGASALIPHEGGATRFGVLYEIGAVIALVGGAAAALTLADRRVRFVPRLAALALLPVPSLAGHALDAGHPRPLNAAVDVLHTGAAAVWVGGLVALGLVFDRDRARRFSALALGSVLVLAATGVTRAVFELSAVAQLWSTGYGRALLVKTVLLGALVALGWLNRYRLIPRGGGRLRLSVRAEALLAAGLVVAVAFLTALPPGRRAEAATTPQRTGPTVLPRPLAGALVLARQDGKLAVALAVLPPRLQAIVLGPDRRGVEGLDVSFRTGGATLAASVCGQGCYEARSPRAGGRIAVLLRGGAYPDSTAAFTVPRSWRPAGAIVRRATSAFRRARSVVFDETLASQPGTRIETRWILAAPNRLSYAIRGGGSGIVIGTRRWDKAPGSGWTPSPQSPLPQPTPTWGPPQDANVLATHGATAVVSFFDPRLYAWFTLTIDRRDNRPRTMRMTTAAHFMTQRYLAYDAPVRISAPAG